MKRAAGQTRSFHSLAADGWWEKFLKDLRRALVEVGSNGLTVAEAQAAFADDTSNVSAGFTYLARSGQAFKSHKTRKRGKSSAASATVWVAEQSYVDAAANPAQEPLF